MDGKKEKYGKSPRGTEYIVKCSVVLLLHILSSKVVNCTRKGGDSVPAWRVLPQKQKQ